MMTCHVYFQLKIIFEHSAALLALRPLLPIAMLKLHVPFQILLPPKLRRTLLTLKPLILILQFVFPQYVLLQFFVTSRLKRANSAHEKHKLVFHVLNIDVSFEVVLIHESRRALFTLEIFFYAFDVCVERVLG